MFSTVSRIVTNLSNSCNLAVLQRPCRQWVTAADDWRTDTDSCLCSSFSHSGTYLHFRFNSTDALLTLWWQFWTLLMLFWKRCYSCNVRFSKSYFMKKTWRNGASFILCLQLVFSFDLCETKWMFIVNRLIPNSPPNEEEIFPYRVQWLNQVHIVLGYRNTMIQSISPRWFL